MNIGPKHIHNIYLSLFPYKFLVDLPQTRVWEWQINLTYHFGHTWNISFIHSSEEHNIIIYTLFSGAYYIYTLLDLWSISFIQLFEPYYYLYTLLWSISFIQLFEAYYLYTLLWSILYIHSALEHIIHSSLEHIIYTHFWSILILVPSTYVTIKYPEMPLLFQNDR